MDARVSAWSFLIYLSLCTPLAASTADDDLVAGRARLFDGTGSGPVRACEHFEAGLSNACCTDSVCYRELLLLHALARTTVLLGDPNAPVVPEGLLRWADQFAATLAVGADRDLPLCRPAGNVWAVPRDAVAARIEDIVAELDAISDRPTPFVMHLAPCETGLKDDLEIDYGDVLMLKGVLLACRASLERHFFVDLRSALDTWLGDAPPFLGFACPPDQDARWRTYWSEAVACYLEAVAYIVAENDPPGTDPQEDELVYVDRDCRAQIDRSAAALAAWCDTPAEPKQQPHTDAGLKVYDIRDANSVRLGELVLVFDNPTGGQTGRFTLADGTALEIDWFGILDAGEIGISMFAPEEATQGWFHGAIAPDRSAITDASVDLWGAEARLIVAVTAQLNTDATAALAEPEPLVGAALPEPVSDAPVPLDELIARAGHEEHWGI